MRGFLDNQKRQQSLSQTIDVFLSTRSRGRTGTASRPLVFETSASTDSAIRACTARLVKNHAVGKLEGAKVIKFLC